MSATEADLEQRLVRRFNAILSDPKHRAELIATVLSSQGGAQAMLDALVAAGTLDEETRTCSFCTVGIAGPDHALVHFDGAKRRLVTEWRP